MLALRSQGKYTEADPLYLRAIEIKEGILGADHPDVAIWLCTRGQLLQSQVRVIVPVMLAPAFTPFDSVFIAICRPDHTAFHCFCHCPTVSINGSGVVEF